MMLQKSRMTSNVIIAIKMKQHTTALCNLSCGVSQTIRRAKDVDSQSFRLQVQKYGHYEGRTRDLGVSRMKAISTTL